MRRLSFLTRSRLSACNLLRLANLKAALAELPPLFIRSEGLLEVGAGEGSDTLGDGFDKESPDSCFCNDNLYSRLNF